ncbi:hypothetical protein H0E87_023324 [Populus deltoides]|uniref:Response regulatory domain-containing protein n=1 Tax=Populus deltoides TaxID=3696 RepID=A0A8T2XDG2_POPDE|nr:hypothetical protein H0E87_023324 [Populus deltoides]
MLRALAPRFLLISYLVILVSASDNDFVNCNCDDEGFWSIHNILECQRVSDFLIAVAYFSIPIELLYFVSCSNFPFKWVLLQFIAFIVLCGLTHLLNAWTYYGPHSFQLILSLTIAKFLTALVSCATAITLLTLIPLLLKWKVRELFLKQNVLELDQEVGMMKKQKEASWHVRMLTQEIRKSLDKHMILYTTLVELSKTLDLQNCASSLPDLVIGDERRAFQVILHMIGYLLNIYDGGGNVIFQVSSENGNEGKTDRMLGMWKPNAPDEFVCIKFDMEISEGSSLSDVASSTTNSSGKRQNSAGVKEGLSFSMCKRLVQMMQGNIWISLNPLGFAQGMTLVLWFQIRPSYGRAIFALGTSSEQPNSNSQFRGLRVVLADDDHVNRTVTKKLLEKLGCEVTAVSSGFECLSALSSAENSFILVVLDLHMPEMDGFEVATRIRKFRSRNWPLIIAVTASAEDNVWERCLQMGMNGVIRKPVLVQGMADELRRVLQRAGEGL